MKYLLSAQSAGVLSQLAWARVLLAFDFDGTLAPIVSERADASMSARTLARFRALCDVYPCAVISGRAKDDVSRRLGGAKVKHVVGNHGLEHGVAPRRYLAQVHRAQGRLEQALAGWPGVDLEDKRYSLAIHYRRSRKKRKVRRQIEAAVAALPDRMRIIHGKLVINLVPSGAPDKGSALLRLRRLEKADVAVYVGDDVTDEDVFELEQPGRLVSVRVGRSSTSAAAYYLKTQREIDELLKRLLQLRERRQPSL
ncbi:MAG: trehalose-phosphatase [Myxococcota bacterium]